MQKFPRPRRSLAPLLALSAMLAAMLGAGPASALEEPPDEEKRIKTCEKRLCTMVLDKPAAGDDLTCSNVSKTWAKSSLKSGEDQGVSWGFGDARCTLDLTISRADIVWALTKPKHTMRIGSHRVNCIVERQGEVKTVVATLSPRLKFKNGEADKVWINLDKIEGPEDVAGTIRTAAALEDSVGIFHRPMIKAINKFLHRRCAERYGPDAKAEADPPPPAKPAPAKAKVSGP